MTAMCKNRREQLERISAALDDAMFFPNGRDHITDESMLTPEERDARQQAQADAFGASVEALMS